MMNIGTHSSVRVGNQIIDLNQEPQPELETNVVVIEVESDDESCITTATSPGLSGLFDSNELLVPLEENEKEYKMIKQRFISGFPNVGNQVSVVAIHKNTFSNRSGTARVESFKAFAEAMGKYRNGAANIKFAWHGASKEMVSEIVRLGFTKIPEKKNQLHGYGVNLAPEKSSIYSLESSVCDEDGLHHVVLCNVILGNLEEIRRGSKQVHPSSVEFDSGVDNLLNPKKYIVWSTNMNTHILPVYVLSFKASVELEGFLRSQQVVKRPTSPWMNFPTLLSMLSRHLPRYKIKVMESYHNYFRRNKIDRDSMVGIIRVAAGDKLIGSVIKSFRAKQQKHQQKMVGGPSGSRPNNK